MVESQPSKLLVAGSIPVSRSSLRSWFTRRLSAIAAKPRRRTALFPGELRPASHLRSRLQAKVAFGACLAIAACDLGPSPQVAGNWSSPGAKFQVVQLQLQQNGDRITGVACGADSGILLFEEAPVTGDLPDIRCEVTAASTQPCCASMAGSGFTGKVEDERGEIAGEYGHIPLRFKPSDTGRCDVARPPTRP